MRTKSIVQVLIAAIIASLLGYLINQLPPTPNFPYRDQVIIGAVVVITLIAAAIVLWQNRQSEEETVLPEPPQQDARSRSQTLLLQAVKQEVISRLDQSLHNAVFINLGKQAQPQQVRRPLDAEVKIGPKSPQLLPTETSILEVFTLKGIDGRLLILGEPGAGKTMTMLDLAKGLCDRAEQNPTAFIPVLLNLSSWKDPKQTMTAWLVEELKSKYGVRKDIGTQWLADKHLLPLLDGLDEVKPEHQEGCVQAINRWLESDDRPPSLAVCCRREEYEKVVRGQWQSEAAEPHNETRMHLNGAILLQTLTDTQIQAYLTATNQPELWQMLRQDEAMWELIRTPLWLSILALSYPKLLCNQWQQANLMEQRLDLLLDAYVEQMLHWELKSHIYEKGKPPTARQIRYWISFLAKQLQQESQTEFLIERIQPSWLYNNAKLKFYEIAFKLTSVCVFSLSGILLRLSKESSGRLFILLIFSMSFGITFGQVGVLPLSIEPVKDTKFSLKIIFVLGIVSLLFGIVFTLVGWLANVKASLLSGAIIGTIMLGTLLEPGFGLHKVDIKPNKIRNQGIFDSLSNATYSFLFIGLFFGLTGLLFLGSIEGLNIGLLLGMRSFLFVGGIAFIQHFILRCILFHSGSIPWNYARFLDYCTERLLLQRVGGRYRFIHKSLQEHFAKMGE
ncbi:MAG: hypothetical protein KME42_21450 [Tildeniella nuda ZEHNDER 1965/U140]|jgi:hypothetical protein|nr:hypothetical protein [Tildeniella nuda ZEHNDER 1965/U140]